ncbi:MAG: AAA family ATPase, partial [Muribaculaceae bacterium]
MHKNRYIFNECDSDFTANNVEYDNIVDGAGFTDDEDDEEANTPSDSGESHSTVTGNRREQRQPGSATPLLDQYGVDLTKEAEENKLDPVVGREREIERLVQILSRRKKNNPVLIGEPGVGKSAVLEGLSQAI